MTNYTWKITNLLTETIDGKQGYVVIAIYDVFGTDGIYSASLTSNMAQFSMTDVGKFIPFKDLKEINVLEWVKLSLGKNGVISIESCIQGQIDSQANPPQTPQNTPLPWSNK